MIYICINETFDGDCDLFYDLDDDETDYLWCDEQGVCSGDYESCPYYMPCLDEKD